jgi:hypothetical protein
MEAELSVQQVIDALRTGVQADMQEKIDKILLTARQKGDTLGVLIDAVADGSTDSWLLSIHMANSLEDMLNEEPVQGGRPS